jgi:hypothetical protein
VVDIVNELPKTVSGRSSGVNCGRRRRPTGTRRLPAENEDTVPNGLPLLRLVLRAEQIASGPLNRASNSDEAAQALLLVARTRRAARSVTERIGAGVVHALYLPSHRDVQLLDAKVERLQRSLEELAADGRDRGVQP